jgi:hypothetical protein
MLGQVSPQLIEAVGRLTQTDGNHLFGSRHWAPGLEPFQLCDGGDYDQMTCGDNTPKCLTHR